MSEKNKKTPRKKQKPVAKVTTGAWWKSTVALQAEISAAKKQKLKTETADGPENKQREVKNSAGTTAQEAAASEKSGSSRLKKAVDKGDRRSDEAGTGRGPEKKNGSPESPEAEDTAVKKADNRQPESKPPENGEAARPEKKRKRGPSGRKTQGASGKKKKGDGAGRKSGSGKGEGKKESRAAIGSEQAAKAAKSAKPEKKPEKKARDAAAEPEKGKEKPPLIKLLINAEEPEECRIAQIEDGKLESFHVTTVVRRRTKNNIYKGIITSIEPTLQAAFVEIGTDRNGFLSFSDIHPEYFREDIDDQSREYIAQHRWRKLRIEKVMAKGQEVLVQVVKEVTGNKGANMTTYLSLPGRYLVLMPGSDSAGISRKISGEEARRNLRDIMSSFSIPEGIGYILRTASHQITKTALQKDLRYLLKLWRKIKKKGQETKAPALIHEDQDVVTRFLRDYFTPEIQEIQVDTQQSFDQVQEFVSLLPAKQRKVKIKLHRGPRPIFNYYNIEEQIESIYQPQVRLPSGGSIVINPTEALVAIDVNSGRTSKDRDFEKTIFQANMEAAAELARQLRLRDLGGLIVVDFIDMRNKRHIREVEKMVKASVKRDKAKIDISRISRFGLMQIARQKMGAPIEKGSYRMCEHCRGRGMVRSVETLALYYMRRIQTGISRKKIKEVECSLPLEIASYLLNKKRMELSELESRHQAAIKIRPVPDMKPGDNQIRFLSDKK